MRERERERIRAVLRGLLPELKERGVVALEWRAGEDWAGDPAVWVRVVLPADAEARGLWEPGRLGEMADRIRGALWEAVDEELFVYVGFRLADEERVRADLEDLRAA